MHGLAVLRLGGCSIELKDCSIKAKDCCITILNKWLFIRVGDCSRKYIDLFHHFYACAVSVIHQDNFWISVKEKVVI